MERKEIIAGYLWPAQWKKPSDSIWPGWWDKKPDGTNDWYTQKDYDRQQKEIVDSPSDEVLDIKPGEYILRLDYPCDGYDTKVIVPEKGITRQELMDSAADAYHCMYQYVNEGIYAKEEMKEDDESFNKYGIWGHSMSDLTIHTFYVDEEKLVITLGVDS